MFHGYVNVYRRVLQKRLRGRWWFNKEKRSNQPAWEIAQLSEGQLKLQWWKVENLRINRLARENRKSWIWKHYINIGFSCTISHRPIHSGKDNSNRPLESLEHTPCDSKMIYLSKDSFYVGCSRDLGLQRYVKNSPMIFGFVPGVYTVYTYSEGLSSCFFSTFQDTVSDNDVWLML